MKNATSFDDSGTATVNIMYVIVLTMTDNAASRPTDPSGRQADTDHGHPHDPPGTESLACPYCGEHNAIPKPTERVRELDFEAAVAAASDAADTHEILTVKCKECAAESTLPPNVTSAPARWVPALGYAGWDAGQLDGEMSRHGWFNVGGDEALLFDTAADARWEAGYAGAGIDPRMLVTGAGHA